MTHPGAIVIDGVIFQMQKHRPHGISRLWHSLLREVSNLPRGQDILLLDRDGTAPQISGIRTRRVHPFSLRDLEGQAVFLDEICREEGAILFASTYYSYTQRTPSLLMLYDMIFELLFSGRTRPANLKGMVIQLEFMAKKMAIAHACAYMAISRSTADDFKKHYPEAGDKLVAIVPCAVSDEFRINGADDIASVCSRYGIRQPYFLLVGRREEYKNALLFLKAFKQMPGREKFQVVMAGGERELDSESKKLLADTPWQIRYFSDRDLSLAYSGAAALVYPSLYEGFGLPLLEAMQSGCPVITCRASSMPEVAGQAALYLEQPDEHHMLKALEMVQQPDVRKILIEKGLRQASLFSWQRSAALFCETIDSVVAGLKTHRTGLKSSFISSLPIPAGEHLEMSAIPPKTGFSGGCPESDVQVSAIVSAYNSETFIRGCLQDLVDQTLFKKGMLEIIVVDSASPQQEGKIAKEFQDRYPNITYLRTDQRETLYQAWNRGVWASRGDCLTSANSDDRHCKDALERMLQALDQRPEVGLVYADVIKTETENETFDRCTPTGRYQWYDWDRNLLLTEGCFMGPQPMWRKSVHEVYGVFDASLVSSGDFEFWLRISQTFDFYHIREPLGLYLVRPDSVEHRNRELKRAEDIQILAVYRRAASSGEILRCVPLDALKQALCQTSCGPNDHLGEIISQIEMLAGLNQYLQNASAGSHWSAADRIVQLKEQILRSHPPAEMVKEFIDLALELMLNQTSWFSRHRENQGTRNGQSSLSAVKTADRQGRGDMGRLRDSNSTTGENIKAKPHWGSSSIARPEPSPDANGKLTRLRNEMAQFWLRVPASDLAQTFSGEAGNLHRELTFGRLKGLPASRDEVQAAQGLLGQAEKGLHEEGLARFLLVEMLYRSPQHLPPRIDLLGVPEWLRCDYTQFLLTCSGFLKEPGESEAYFDCLDQLTGCLCDAIRKEPQSPTWQRIALLFAEKANFIPLYFSRRNLKAIYIRRAEIVDYTLRLRKCDCDYAIPPRPIGRAKLRLGIHCRSLRPQPEVFATLPVFESLDREKFEIFFYVHSCNGSPLEERVRRATDKFTVLPEAIKPCAEIIRADDLDILFFGNNITAVHNQSFVLANYRMARVQCIHFCNPVTSGKRHIDHFLLGQLIVGKQELKERFAEKILTIDGSGICFDIPEFVEAPEQRLSRMDLGIGNGKTVFVSGANCYKIIPELRHTWAKILKQVPESVLVLYPFGPAWSDAYPKQLLVEDMIRVFAGYGLLSNRLIVLDTLGGKEDILALNRIADVYLDAVPYSGATSLLEPLQVGIPPVVADRRELRFSQGAAMIRELGIHELIARDEEDYIRIAVRLGSDTCLREEMRGRIQRQMAAGPDFLNPRLYAQRIGRVFRSLFQDLDRLSGRDSNLKKPDIPTQEVTTCYT